MDEKDFKNSHPPAVTGAVAGRAAGAMGEAPLLRPGGVQPERVELARTGESASLQRARRLGHEAPGQGPNDQPLPSPGIAGGDRRRDAERDG